MFSLNSANSLTIFFSKIKRIAVLEPTASCAEMIPQFHKESGNRRDPSTDLDSCLSDFISFFN